MLNISEKQFYEYKSLKKSFPIFRKINGDELTPIAIYYNLQGENKFLLESIHSEIQIGRYSFIGVEPYMSIKSYKENIVLEDKDGIKEDRGMILEYIKQYLEVSYDSLDLDIPFAGGAVGYVGYDIIKQYEKIPDKNRDDLKIPETFLMFYRTFACYDHFKHQIYLIYNVINGDEKDYKEICLELDEIDQMIISGNAIHKLPEAEKNKEFESNISKQRYCEMVEKAKEYIKAGDIFQIVLSQRLKFKNVSNPFDVYRRLREKNPSPYLFYMDFGNVKIVGSSPESLVTVKDGRVTTNPIAGTRPRGKTIDQDLNIEQELLEDEKEKAEHVMLLDLGRNDIGKISEFGSVTIDKFMEIEKYSHVMHIVSEVSGKLKKGLHYLDALKSCLPVGTVSGAPKIRAMEIIDELEDTKRGAYAGAVGYFSYNGNMDTCIAIRTILYSADYAYVQAGAGIVYDSIPENEYNETLNKSMAMKEVI